MLIAQGHSSERPTDGARDMVKQRDRRTESESRSDRVDEHWTRPDFDTYFPLCYVVLYVIALLILYRRYFPIGDTGVETDFYGDMAVAARELLRGNFAVKQYPYKGPVYPFVLAFFFTVIRDWYRSGVILNIIFSAATIVVLYRLVRAIFNRSVAVFTAVSVSLVFEFFLIAHKAASDMLFLFFFMLVLERMLTGRLSMGRLCAAAVASALAFLTRYNGVFVPIGVLVVLLVFNPYAFAIRRRLAFMAVYALIFLAVCAPWFIASYAGTGSVLSTKNIENIVEEFYGDRVPDEGFSSLGDIVMHDPTYFITHYLANIPRHFWEDLNGTIGIEAGILVMIGLLRLVIVPPSRRQSSFYFFACLYFLLLCAIFHLRRFSIPLAPALYALAFSFLFGSGAAELSPAGKMIQRSFAPQLQRVGEMLNRVLWSRRSHGSGKQKERKSRESKQKQRRRIASSDTRTAPGSAAAVHRFVITVKHGLIAALIVTLVVFQVLRIISFERMYYDRRPLFVAAAARFLRAPAFRLGTERPILMARKPHLAFYADMRFQHYPDFFHSLTHFLSFAMERDVDYIVYSTIEKEHFPEAEFLVRLDETSGIEKIYETKEIFIYRLAEWLDLSKEAGRELLEQYETNLIKAESDGNLEEILRECYNISGMYSVNGEWEKKMEYLSRALAAIEQSPDSSSLLNHAVLLELNISEAHLMIGSYHEGIATLERILPTIERLGVVSQMASAHIILSKHYEGLRQWADAQREMSIVRDIYVVEGDTKKIENVDKAIERLGKLIQ